jgi:uncharacterized membrane protein YeaQ/YmgE (transglycosylase-associated protein family)
MLYTILIGLAAGALAKFIMPGKDPGGIIVTILLGIGGALVATFLGQFVGLYGEGESARFIGATAGAILILWIYRVINKKKALSSGK